MHTCNPIHRGSTVNKRTNSARKWQCTKIGQYLHDEWTNTTINSISLFREARGEKPLNWKSQERSEKKQRWAELQIANFQLLQSMDRIKRQPGRSFGRRRAPVAGELWADSAVRSFASARFVPLAVSSSPSPERKDGVIVLRWNNSLDVLHFLRIYIENNLLQLMKKG